MRGDAADSLLADPAHLGLTIPKETRMSRLQIGDIAPDVTLPDQSGKQIRLSDRWIERPLVLEFLRHFG